MAPKLTMQKQHNLAEEGVYQMILELSGPTGRHTNIKNFFADIVALPPSHKLIEQTHNVQFQLPMQTLPPMDGLSFYARCLSK